MKSESGGIAKSDPSLLGRTDSTRVNVFIKYDLDASASYAGGVAGLAPTSPRVTGKPLSANPAAVAAYNSYAASTSQKITAAAAKAAPGLKVVQTFNTVYGGVSGSVPANKIGALLATKGVAAVQKDTLNQPQDDNTSFVGATNVWPTLGGSSNAGSNVVYANIDSGVWPEHPMLAPGSLGAPAGGLRGCADFSTGDPALGPAFACNNKLIGAYAKTATYMAATGAGAEEFCNNSTHKCSPRDSEGHGTHTTTTAAGDCVASAVLYGVERGPVCGIAPGARVIEYRVCLRAGCYGSDSVSAVQQAILDGANVINFSISGGANPYSDAVELAFLDATNAGISVNASAGNSGPGAGTSDHGGPWTTTVGASTGPRSFLSTLHLAGDGAAPNTFDVVGNTLTNGISSATPVVLADTLPKAGGGLEDALCQSDLAAGAATGKIVACQRGTNGRIDKGRRVLQGGAAGMILYNAIKQDVETDNHYLPTIHVDGPSTALLAFINGHTNVTATWAQGSPQPTQADMMASFSSRGPTGDWIKPDVTAPGVQVLAGTTPQPDQTTADNGPPGNQYMAIAGTSMSSPHSAGVSILVKAAHPSWTPSEIKSALMTSSVQTVIKEDGITAAGPFDMGAGSIRADRAVNPTLVFGETYANFAAAGADTLHRIDLNLASVDATTFTGEISTTRTVRNVSGASQNMAVQITQPSGVDIQVGNKNHDLHIAKDATFTFPITISAPDIANGQYTARIDLTPAKGGNKVTMPVAFVKTQGKVTLSNVCSPLSIVVKTGVSDCTVGAANFASTPANVSLSVGNREKGKTLRYQNVGAPGSVIGGGDGVQWSGTLSPAMAPAVASIAPGGEPYGYFPLGGAAIAATDESIANFTVPAFLYGGETYTRVGVVSDGYVVIGGGEAQDVEFIPQTFPDPARPNNVVAPIWTDLNPTFGGAIRAGLVNDGVSTWIVADFRAVRNYTGATTHTFEVWIRVGTAPGSEQISMVYDAAANAGTGDPDAGVNWGAENRDASSGKNLAAAPPNSSTYEVTLSPPTAGGSVSIPFQIYSKKTGTYHSDATMTSDVTPGTTLVGQAITVH